MGRSAYAFIDARMDIEDPPTSGSDSPLRLDHAAQRLQALDQLDDGVWIAEPGGELLYRNQIAAQMERMFWSRSGLVGTMEDVVFNQDTLARLHERGNWSAEFHLSSEDDQERSVMLQMHRLPDDSGLVFHARDISREWLREQALQDRHVELEQAYSRLKQTQSQLLQSEKMASIGQLAAGVAHEINNPIGYVHSNLGTLQTYLRGLVRLLDAYEQLCRSESGERLQTVDAVKAQINFDFMREDLPALLLESREGIERVKKIVLDLRDFSHGGQSDVDEWMQADVHRGLESTLNIVWNELKYKAEVRKEYAALPLIACIPSQLNQVFLNLLINAGQAISERGVITIRTSQVGGEVCIAISDTGIGIPAEHIKRIFDPFFTTKAVGKGTGLGLSLSYGIVQKHHGRIEVQSQPGIGTTFLVFLPIQRAAHSS